MTIAWAAACRRWVEASKSTLRSGGLFVLTSFYVLSQAMDVRVFHLGVDIHLARLAMLAMAVGLALLVRGSVLEALRPLRPLLLIALCWTLYLGINGVLGLNARTSLELLLRFVGVWVIACELAVLLHSDEGSARRAIGWALLVTLLVLALIQYLKTAGVPWLDLLRHRIRNAQASSPRAQALYVNPNILGMVLVFHAATLSWYTLHRRGSLVIMPLAWLTALWVILQSQSRSALIGLISVCLLSSLAYWKAFLTQAGRKTRVIIFSSAVVFVIALLGFTLHSSVRFSALAVAVFRVDPQRTLVPAVRLDPNAIDPARVYIWKTAIAVWLEQPWFGIGLGGFKHLPEIGQFHHAHNFLLTVLVEQGLIGVVFLGVFGVLLVRRMRSWVGAALLVSVFFTQLFDDLAPIVAFPIYMALVLGYCLFLALPRSVGTCDAQPDL